MFVFLFFARHCWGISGASMTKPWNCISVSLLYFKTWLASQKKETKSLLYFQICLLLLSIKAAQPCATKFIQFPYIWHLAIEHLNSEVSMNQMVESKSTHPTPLHFHLTRQWYILHVNCAKMMVRCHDVMIISKFGISTLRWLRLPLALYGDVSWMSWLSQPPWQLPADGCPWHS